jgi:1,4-alpha-glucan branching enzyme
MTTNKRSVFAINWAEVELLAAGHHDNPHHILGMHESVDGVYINAYFPGAESVTAVSKNTKDTFNLTSDRIPGFFTIKIPEKQSFVYYYVVNYPDGKEEEIIDPYSFEPVIDPIDISRFGDGIHYEIFEKMGAHPCMLDGVEGVLFAVWAPRAVRVSVVGNFNKWNGSYCFSDAYRMDPDPGIFRTAELKKTKQFWKSPTVGRFMFFGKI